MKTCPVCQATCFDDMDVCYGCMHRFPTASLGKENPSSKKAAGSGSSGAQGAPAVRPGAFAVGEDGIASLRIPLGSSEYELSVQVRPVSAPAAHTAASESARVGAHA
ncbi:hypothetical protein AAY81_01015 [Denitrobacterium detoxificans]|uniref:Uncharacterized protein n=1 Tax=Denitrobacterium detoxificans TaxID=79604 RepID=A0A172RWE6_9ACTN|nr:hypothetical protein [Denitrobacterium detoxificans]ANE21975.1 hypothetical protein AAY81_01015 [Denitrobacterium detoxificans]SEO97876.1 hypothetical protein SAMN02910314_01800 [Denitrobacterium detoxificans]